MAQKMTPTRKTRREDSFDREAPKEEEDDEVILDFSEAQSKLKEDENKRRVEEGLTVGLTKEVSLRGPSHMATKKSGPLLPPRSTSRLAPLTSTSKTLTGWGLRWDGRDT